MTERKARNEELAEGEVTFAVQLLTTALHRGLDFDTVNDAADILRTAAWRLSR